MKRLIAAVMLLIGAFAPLQTSADAPLSNADIIGALQQARCHAQYWETNSLFELLDSVVVRRNENVVTLTTDFFVQLYGYVDTRPTQFFATWIVTRKREFASVHTLWTFDAARPREGARQRVYQQRMQGTASGLSVPPIPEDCIPRVAPDSAEKTAIIDEIVRKTIGLVWQSNRGLEILERDRPIPPFGKPLRIRIGDFAIEDMMTWVLIEDLREIYMVFFDQMVVQQDQLDARRFVRHVVFDASTGANVPYALPGEVKLRTVGFLREVDLLRY